MLWKRKKRRHGAVLRNLDDVGQCSPGKAARQVDSQKVKVARVDPLELSFRIEPPGPPAA